MNILTQGYVFLAQAVSETGTVEVGSSGESQSWWVLAIAFVIGIIGEKLLRWLSGSSEKAQEALIKLQDKVNQNSIASQIQADDAVIKIIHDSIPLLVGKLDDRLKKAFKDNKLSKKDFEGLVGELWEVSKPQIIEGKNDYLKHSSFEDGKAVVSMVLEKFLTKKKEGLA